MNPNERQLLLATISKIKNIATKRFNNNAYDNIHEIFNLLEKDEQTIILREFTVICFIVDDEVISESKEKTEEKQQLIVKENEYKDAEDEAEIKEQAALKFWIYKVLIIISTIVTVILTFIGFVDPVKFFSNMQNNISGITEILKVILWLN